MWHKVKIKLPDLKLNRILLKQYLLFKKRLYFFEIEIEIKR